MTFEFHLLPLALIIMDARMLINSFISSKRDSNLFSGISLVAMSKRIQYLVSEGVILRFPQNADRPNASFNAIDNLWIKSAVL